MKSAQSYGRALGDCSFFFFAATLSALALFAEPSFGAAINFSGAYEQEIWQCQGYVRTLAITNETEKVFDFVLHSPPNCGTEEDIKGTAQKTPTGAEATLKCTDWKGSSQIVFSFTPQKHDAKSILSLHVNSRGCVEWPSKQWQGTGRFIRHGEPFTYGPGFNCDAEPLSKVEMTICTTQWLSAADREITHAFAGKKASLEKDAAKKLTVWQKDWLRRRNSCGQSSEIETCLTKSYEQGLLQYQDDGDKCKRKKAVDFSALRCQMAGSSHSLLMDPLLALHISLIVGKEYKKMVSQAKEGLTFNEGEEAHPAPDVKFIGECIEFGSFQPTGILLTQTGELWFWFTESRNDKEATLKLYRPKAARWEKLPESVREMLPQREKDGKFKVVEVAY